MEVFLNLGGKYNEMALPCQRDANGKPLGVLHRKSCGARFVCFAALTDFVQTGSQKAKRSVPLGRSGAAEGGSDKER